MPRKQVSWIPCGDRSTSKLRKSRGRNTEKKLTHMKDSEAGMCETLKHLRSSELELARRKAAFDEELAAKEKLRQAVMIRDARFASFRSISSDLATCKANLQEAEAFERETLQREREELEKQKAFLFALSLQRNYEDQAAKKSSYGLGGSYQTSVPSNSG